MAKKKYFLGISFLLVSILVLTTVSLSLKNPIVIKQRAAFGSAQISFQPSSGAFIVNQEYPVDLMITNNEQRKVGAFKITLTFDPTKFQVTRFDNDPTNFPTMDNVVNDPLNLGQSSGTATLEAINTNTNLPNAINLKAGTIWIKGKVLGSFPVDINLASSLLVGDNPDPNSTDVIITIGSVSGGSYSISLPPTSTPTPSLTPTPTITPTPSPTPQPTNTPTPTSTPTPRPTNTPTPTATNTPRPTNTPTIIPSPTPTNAPTNTPIPTPTPTPNPCVCSLSVPTKISGNANCDGVIDLVDFQIWTEERWGRRLTATSDFNCDTRVDIQDFMLWLRGRWRQP